MQEDHSGLTKPRSRGHSINSLTPVRGGPTGLHAAARGKLGQVTAREMEQDGGQFIDKINYVELVST